MQDAIHVPIGLVIDAQGGTPAETWTSAETLHKLGDFDAGLAEIERLQPEKQESAVVHHTVKSGETLYSIAAFYKTTVAALKRDNRNVAVIRPGMILTIQSAR